MAQIFISIGVLLAYFVIMASIALVCRFTIHIPDELFRKILHCILLGSLLPFVFAFDSWKTSALTAIEFAIVVYPILVFFERFQAYSKITTQRKEGELKHSLLLVFAMFATVITICWGGLDDKYLVLASVYAWGFGDAAAALVGKRFGKHKIRWKLADSKKSIEGSAAMFGVSFLSVVVILLIRGGLSLWQCILTALVTALVSTFAELCSHNGNDTVICPLSAMAVLIPMLYLFGGLV